MASLAAPVSVRRPAAGRLRIPRYVIVAAVIVLAAAVLFTALPGAYTAVSDGIAQIPHANAGWIAIAIGLEALSFLGHIVLFRAVFVAEMPGSRGVVLKIGHFDEVAGITHVEI